MKRIVQRVITGTVKDSDEFLYQELLLLKKELIMGLLLILMVIFQLL